MIKLTLASGLLSLACLCAQGQQVEPLKLQGYVNDSAGIFSVQESRQISDLCGELEQTTKARILVVAVAQGVPVDGDGAPERLRAELTVL